MKFRLPLLISVLLSLLIIIAEPQDTSLQTIIIIFLSIWFLLPTLMLGIPENRKELYEKVSKFSIILQQFIILLIAFVIPFVVIAILGILDLLSIILWYFVPLIFFQSTILQKRFHTIPAIIGAALLWIGFDHRYTGDIFDNFNGLGYVMNSLWIVQIAFITYGLYTGIKQEDIDLDVGIKPSKYAFKIANQITPLISLIIIPFGLLTHFLEWNPVKFDAFEVIVGFIGIFFTIALQEELIFRGIFLHEFDETRKLNSNISLILVSILFALTHWNNETGIYIWLYFFSAFITGIGYGLSYRKGGLFAAMISHTLVDWFWALLLKRS